MSAISTAPARTPGDPHEPAVLLLYGEEYANLALVDELALDGYEVRRASDPAIYPATMRDGLASIRTLC